MTNDRAMTLTRLWNSDRWARIGMTLFFGVVANLMIWAASGGVLGGDGLSGRVEGKRHLISTGDGEVEVSRFAFWASRTHAILTLATVPLGLGAFCLLFVAQLRLRDESEAPLPTHHD